MKTQTLLFISVSIAFYSCGQEPVKSQVAPAAVRLNNTAMSLVPFMDNADSSKKAVSLLDSATLIDSNYFLGYYNKLMFLYQLKEYGKAVTTIDKLIALRPNAHDLYLSGGMLYQKKGDTVKALQYFQKSLAICNNALDTMSQANRDYEMLSNNRKELIRMIDNLGGR